MDIEIRLRVHKRTIGALLIFIMVGLSQATTPESPQDCPPRLSTPTRLTGAPPAFPDFENIFKNTLADFANLRRMYDDFQDMMNQIHPGNCTCPWRYIDGGVAGFNSKRCTTNEDILPEQICPFPTTTTTTTTTTTPPTTTQTSTTYTTKSSTTTHTSSSTSTTQTSTTQTSTSSTQSSSTKSSTTVTQSSTQKSLHTTTGETDIMVPVTNPDSTMWSWNLTTTGVILPTQDAVVDKQTDMNVVYYVVGAGAGLLLILIVGVVICSRKHSNANSGTVVLRSKAKRQMSERQLISSSQEDIFSSKPTTPTLSIASTATAGSFKFKNSRRWQPEYERSESGSIDIMDRSRSNSFASTKYLIPEEGSVDQESFHYNTLKASQKAHAEPQDGFGESSTDFTLPRKGKKGDSCDIKANGSVRYKKGVDPNDCDLEIITDTMKSKPGLGYVTYENEIMVDKAPSPGSESCSNSDTSKTDSAIDSNSLSDSETKDWAAPENRPKSLATDSSEDLVNNKNLSLFAYDNKAFVKSNDVPLKVLPSQTKSSEVIVASDTSLSKRVVEPPPEFQDLNAPDSGVEDYASPTAERKLSVKNLRDRFEKKDDSSSGSLKRAKSPSSRTSSLKRDDSSQNKHQNTNRTLPLNNKPNTTFLHNGKPVAEIQPTVKTSNEHIADVRL